MLEGVPRRGGAPGLAIRVLRGALQASRGGGANEGRTDDGCDGL